MYSGGNNRNFSESIADASYAQYLVTGDKKFGVSHLTAMEGIFDKWKDHYDQSKGLYFIAPIADATEYSIASIDASGGRDGFGGGDAFRPSINSFMYGNALAISSLAKLSGDSDAEKLYADKAQAIKNTVETQLWSKQFGHFIDRFKADNQYVHYWDPIRGRELVGYLPWAFNLPSDTPEFAASWTHLLDSNGFASKVGFRTVEPSYQYYMIQYRYAWEDGIKKPECEWNGPVWPFDNTYVLTAMANLLDNYHQSIITKDDYVRLLKQYAHLHYGADGQPDLQEDYNPDTGLPIVGLHRSHHYNHSGFNDLIINGLVGIRPRSDNVLEINPLVSSDANSPNTLSYFCLDNVLYHGCNITVIYDRNGKKYKRGKGLTVIVNGKTAVKNAALGHITVKLPQAAIPAPEKPIDHAVNYWRRGLPTPDASVNNHQWDLYQAVDGRVWFFSNVRNYWTNEGSQNAEDWYSVDFGQPTALNSVELYFYGDGKKYAAPSSLSVQYWDGAAWDDVRGDKGQALTAITNGQTSVHFSTVNASKIRVAFKNAPGFSTALVEFKAF
jgi:hypothetical protein